MLAFRWIALCAFAGLLTAALTSGLLWRDTQPRSNVAAKPIAAGSKVTSAGAPSASRCPHAIPSGESFETVWATTVFFVTDVLMSKNPVCGFDLSSDGLRGKLTRAQWANGEGPIEIFVTQYPAVPVAMASKDPAAPEAVYVLSRTVRELVVSDGRGRVKAPMKVGLFAPDAGMAAYNLELVLENGHWRVDKATAVALTMSDEPALRGSVAETG